ncbi:hypothetical protein AWB81_07869 [Caballeronia arationis]|jgi:hypothetical protein|uniref:Uncharacterized protein n=1 Tax=Caballeronia arationis TaxID=1777142 RepID=A0A7Z7N3F8_9BURK|nr:hypothetical protein AWB81_07869 [Caballeronia arationis]SOE67378.1 hypothetical protein SAMN05446927_3288 [Caballeronia arationis]
MRYVLVRTDNDERTPLAIDITIIEDIGRRVTSKFLLLVDQAVSSFAATTVHADH